MSVFKTLTRTFCLSLHISVYLEAFENNITSDWLDYTVYPIRSSVTFKLKKRYKKDKECS